MGLHSPWMYVGYEDNFLETFIGLLDRFCSTCHTNDDFEEGCKGCPIGNLIYRSKNYVLDAHESDGLETEVKKLRAIKEEIEPIEPYPLFNRDWIWQKEKTEDRLRKLRKLLRDLKFIKRQRNRRLHEKFKFEDDTAERAVKRVEQEFDKELQILKDGGETNGR